MHTEKLWSYLCDSTAREDKRLQPFWYWSLMLDQTCNKIDNNPQMLYKGETVVYYIKEQMHVLSPPIYDFFP